VHTVIASEEARGRGYEAWAVYAPDGTLLASSDELDA